MLAPRYLALLLALSSSAHASELERFGAQFDVQAKKDSKSERKDDAKTERIVNGVFNALSEGESPALSAPETPAFLSLELGVQSVSEKIGGGLIRGRLLGSRFGVDASYVNYRCLGHPRGGA